MLSHLVSYFGGVHEPVEFFGPFEDFRVSTYIFSDESFRFSFKTVINELDRAFLSVSL